MQNVEYAYLNSENTGVAINNDKIFAKIGTEIMIPALFFRQIAINKAIAANQVKKPIDKNN